MWVVPLSHLTEDQLNAVQLSTAKHRVVVGGPGSGKTLVLAHRRTLKRIFTRDVEIVDWRLVMSLRLAALIYRSRADIALPEMECKVNGDGLRLGMNREWLASNPLTVTALQEEIDEWAAAGYKLDIKSLRELEAGVEAKAA